MDGDSSNRRRRRRLAKEQHSTNLLPHSFAEAESENEGGGAADVENSEMWTTFTESFQQVQSVLDRNRVLIQQVNENQRSKIHDNLVKNVSLIQEINGNITKVVALYSDLSVNFSNMCHDHRNAAIQSKNPPGKTDS